MDNKFPVPRLIDNSPMGLVDLLVKRIDGVLRDSWWRANEFGEDSVPHVHAQFLPVSLTANEERDKSRDYPLVQVFYSKGKIDTPMDSSADVHILFGGWNPDKERQGWRIPGAMMWAVVQNLLSFTQLGGYTLQLPLEWEFPPDQESPYWGTTLITHWNGTPPADEISEKYHGPGAMTVVDFDKEDNSVWPTGTV